MWNTFLLIFKLKPFFKFYLILYNLDDTTKAKFIELDKKNLNKISMLEKEKQKRKEQHRKWMKNNDERYNLYHSLINNK